MNWTSLKTYLIVLLVSINLFLGFSYINSLNKDSYLDDGAILNTVEILGKHGIQVEASEIPTRVYDSGIIECPYSEDYYEKVAISISSSEKESINILPDNSIKITTESGESFTFDSGFGITYSKAHATDDATLLSLENSSDSEKPTSLTKEQNKALSSFLYPEYQGSKTFSYSVISVTKKNEENVIVVCEQNIGGIPVSDHSITVEMDKNSVIYASGYWFFPLDSKSYSYKLYDQLSILIKEAQYSNSENAHKEGYKITTVDHVYSTYWSANRDNVYFVPSWSITTDNSEKRIYNAINCEPYS